MEAPEGSFFLFGPRGTGKTTWLRESFPKALFIDLLKPDVHRTLSARPERIAEMAEGSAHKIVVLDEVQRVPELLNVVHDLEGWVRRIGNFARFLEVMSFSHAQVLNLTNVARECEVGRKTVAGYLKVLEDLLLSFRVPVFTRRARRATAAHPKFYYFDAGVFVSLRPKGPLDRRDEIDGASLEGIVAQHLRAWTAYSSKKVDLFYWRTRSGVEVDFVLYGQGGFWAFEVKNGRDVRPEDLRSLKTFREDYPECEPMFLHRGTDRLRIDGIACVPVDEFLRGLEPFRGPTDL